MRIAAAACGLLLMALAGLLRRDSAAFYADAGQLHVGSGLVVPVWAVVAASVVVVLALAAATGHGRALARAVLQPGRRLGLALSVALVGLSLVPWEYSWVRPSRSHLVLYTALGSLGAGLFVFGAWRRGATGTRRGSRPFGGVGRAARTVFERLVGLGRWRFILLCAGFVLVVSALAAVLVFERIPHVQDSIAQLFQARIFAAGRLWLESPGFADFFDYGHAVNDGRWYSVYPFLHSLALVPGVLAGAPWLVNPLFGAGFAALAYALGREAYGERTGRAAALLACASPWLWAMSGEYMNHASALVLLTGFLVLGLRTLRTGGAGAALGAGLLLGLGACVRPYTALAFGLPLVAYTALRAREPGGLRRLGLLVLGGAVTGALLLAHNRLTNGDPLLFGYVAKYGPGHEIGFGHSGWGAAHTPLRGLLNVGHDLNLFNRFVLEWPAPTLLLVMLPFLRGTRDRRDWLLLASFLALPAAYFFYWSHGLAFGPRFLYEALGPVLVLVARGLTPMEMPATGRKTVRVDFAARFVPVALVFALLAGLPPLWRWYRGYWGVDGRLLAEARARRLDNALVFCSELGDAFNANSLDLDGPVVYARDLGPLNPALTLAYPGRDYFIARKGELVRADGLKYSGSALSTTLAALASEAGPRAAGYRTVIWPLRDVPPAAPGLPPLTDYRSLSAALQSGRSRLEEFLPALALWVDGDPRGLGVFGYLERSDYFEAGGIDFRQLATVPGGRVFDIRPAR
ncbi:MAG: hypothetical protein R6X13_12225 [bacterium]